MNPEEICYLSAGQLGRLMKKKELSPVEVIKTHLSRIESLEPKLNSFITLLPDQAMAAALQAEKEIQGGNYRGPLHGIPLGLKDLYSTKGIKTTAGSKVLANYLPPFDATVVGKLKEAGVIIIGKTNLDAWAHGSSGENSDFGPTKNPWDLSRVPGGSSSGSAAALASQMILAATGTDTGGSIRLPASFCNLVGLKPTYGRVSRYGIVAMASSLDAIGHLTKDVTDSALMLKVTAGQDSFDSTTPKTAVPDYLQGIKKNIAGLKIGIPKEYLLKGMDERIKSRFKGAVSQLEKLGAKVSEISLPHTSSSLAVYYIVQPAEVSSNLARYDGIRYGCPRSEFGAEAKRRIMLGTYTLSSGYYEAYYLQAMKVRTLIKNDFDQAFKKVDVLVAPVSPVLPFKLGEKIDDPLAMYLSDILTVPMNLAGVPSLAVPMGFVENLPVGMQIVGPQFSEEILFRVGYNYEQAR